MKYFIIAGEASGDLHGANLIKALLQKDSNAEIEFWGGDEMQKITGKSPLKHISELAFMGFVEVLLNLKTILGNISQCKKQIEAFKPNAVVFIDYPGFNLRIADWAKNQGFKTIYYISPQIWAWKENRVKIIKRSIDEMICILPFELDFYKKHQVEAHYVGHPLLDAIENLSPLNEDNYIALLPGSRKQEIAKMLPVMLQTAQEFSNETFVIAAAPAISKSYYDSFSLPANVKIEYNKTQQIIIGAKAALVTSGTATLQTAIFETPLVVCYKANPISVAIAKRLVKIRYISLVNLIADKELVTELIQENFNVENLKIELEKILEPLLRDQMILEFKALKNLLGNKGASIRAAQIIYSTVA